MRKVLEQPSARRFRQAADPARHGVERGRQTGGEDRLGDNLFANSLLALDANTGKRIWHFQTVQHDVWDRDVVSPPALITVKRDGKDVEAVEIATKSGYVWLFDRTNGTPLFPIERNKYPPSKIPGEQLSETQPFPTKPAPFARQRLTE